MIVSTPDTREAQIGPAIALRVSATLFATLLGFCVHAAATEVDTGQIVFLRSLLSIPALLLWALMTGPVSALRPRSVSKHVMRGTLGGCAMILNFYALGQLPVTNAQAISYLTPVLSIPVAVMLLGERLTTRAVMAVSLGFAGMMAMLYTSFAQPDWGWAELSGMGAGLAAAGIMAFVRVHIRAMTATESVMSIALSFAVITGTMGGIAVLIFGWTPMSGTIWLWLIGAGVMGAAAHITATEAMARAPVSVLAPFDYAGLVFAVALDFAVFAHLPGAWGWIGIVLIAMAGALTLGGARPIATGRRGL